MLQFLEAMGYEAFAAELRSVAKVRRLIGQGREDLVESAKDKEFCRLVRRKLQARYLVRMTVINYAIRKDEDHEYSTHMGNLWLIPNMKIRIPKMKILLETMY